MKKRTNVELEDLLRGHRVGLVKLGDVEDGSSRLLLKSLSFGSKKGGSVAV